VGLDPAETSRLPCLWHDGVDQGTLTALSPLRRMARRMSAHDRRPDGMGTKVSHHRYRLLPLALAFLLVPFTLDAEPIPAPGVEIVATGCSPCATGDRAVLVLSIVNPGAARGVQIAALLRHPNGTTLPLPVHGQVMLLPAGPSALTLADFTVPGGTPGVYLIEAALLDPQTGVTLARDVLGVSKE
jgi:hypothetical protein